MLLNSLIRHGLVVRIAGSHPAGPVSIPGAGKSNFTLCPSDCFITIRDTSDTFKGMARAGMSLRRGFFVRWQLERATFRHLIMSVRCCHLVTLWNEAQTSIFGHANELQKGHMSMARNLNFQHVPLLMETICQILSTYGNQAYV